MAQMVEILQSALDATFTSDTKDIFKRYIESQQVAKWMIFSDFCINNKPNDTVSFVFVPYVINIEHLVRLTAENILTDLKHASDLHPQVREFLRLHRLFSVTIILDKNRKLYVSDGHGSRQKKYLTSINEAIRIYKDSPVEKKFKELAQNLKSRSPNLKLLDDILLVSFFGAYLSSNLAQYCKNVEKIGWFPDRDKLVSSYNGIIYDLMNQNFHTLSPTSPAGVMSFGKMEESGDTWYDSLNRIPDYLSGAIADYDLTKKVVSHKKHARMLEDVFADNNQHMVFKMNFEDSGIRFGKININRKAI